MSVSPFVQNRTVSALSEIQGDLPQGQAILVERDGQPRWLVMACPCGCREEIRVNLDRRSGPAWRIYTLPKGSFSVYPSVWRDSGCGSHFIIWSNRLYMLGRYREDDDPVWIREQHAALLPLVRARLGDKPVHFVELADAMRQVPWDVLDALKALARSGEVREGRGKEHGWFTPVR